MTYKNFTIEEESGHFAVRYPDGDQVHDKPWCATLEQAKRFVDKLVDLTAEAAKLKDAGNFVENYIQREKLLRKFDELTSK